MNDEINRLLARIEALENTGVSDDIKAKIDIINRLTLPPSITKQCDCKADIESLQTQLNELKARDVSVNEGKIDSIRRTFGDEVSVLALAVDKRLKALEQNNGE